MWTYPTVAVLLLALVAGVPESTSGPEISSGDLEVSSDDPEVSSDDRDLSSRHLEVSPGDLEASSDDREVNSSDPTAAQERQLRASPADEEEKNPPKHVLPINKQVSAFLPGRQYKRFLYRQNRKDAAISLVVTPCSAELVGSITFLPDNIGEGGKREVPVRKIRGPGQEIYSARRGEQGSYEIHITARADTYVHFLATDEDLAGLGSLQTKVVAKNKTKSRVEIDWSPGSHGDQALRYCLITSPTGHFSSICGGLSAKFGLQSPDGSGARRRRRRQQGSRPAPRRRRPVQNSNITVGCVGKSTVHMLHDLVPGRPYFVTVFGQYQNKSVSFQYGKTDFIYQDPSTRTTRRIRQRKPTQLRLTPARPFCRLELFGPSDNEQLHFFVVSCGGPLHMRLRRSFTNDGWSHRVTDTQVWKNINNGELIASHINSSRLVSKQDKYQFEVTAIDGATTVELQATWRHRWLRAASLKGRPRVRAASQRRRERLGLNCTQLALRMPRASGRRLEYCVLLEPDTSGRSERRFKKPSACGLESRLQHSPANMTRCGPSRQLRKGKRVEVIFDGLTPGQSYVARAMVRPRKGRFVPYYLSQVTVPPCSEERPNELTEGIVGGLEPISALGAGGRLETEQVDGRRQAPRQGNAQARAEAAEEANNELNDWIP